MIFQSCTNLLQTYKYRAEMAHNNFARRIVEKESSSPGDATMIMDENEEIISKYWNISFYFLYFESRFNIIV